MKTNHKLIFKNSNDMEEINSESVNLIVTSPPYPMIQMWDELFSSLDTEIENALNNEDGPKAYDLMNKELYKTWVEIDRVLAPGGIVCINIGDATRKIGKSFQLYANHSRITYYFEKMGYQVLPTIIWRKETNKPNKFMGSGMLPTNAYVTLEHEYILIFRKNGNRTFNSKEIENRRSSAYFWEERNIWFSDVWTDLKGISQKLNHKELRERTAAYPFELAYRLINMYSVQGDTVLDPFLGTGTTTIAALSTGRNSIGYEIDPNFKSVIELRLKETVEFSKSLTEDRLKQHLNFVKKRKEEKGNLKHKSISYGFEVMTNQEKNILLPLLKKIEKVENNEVEAFYEKTVNPNQIKNLKKKEIQNKLF
mgnify:CR=1 FL=1